MKKIALFSMLTFSVLSLSLAGCGNKKTASTNDSKPKQETKKATQKSSSPVSYTHLKRQLAIFLMKRQAQALRLPKTTKANQPLWYLKHLLLITKVLPSW